MQKEAVRHVDFFLEAYILHINRALSNKTYKPLPYRAFYVYDPKKRHIHSAEVIDRLVQQALFQKIEPIFDSYFIHDSYSSRQGTHAGVNRLESFLRKETSNYRENAYVLKCDIRKFFDSIDHCILKELIRKKITDENTLWLIDVIINSFEKEKGKGLPLGNVTSQLFGNIYMHVFDHFVKHDLKIKYYIRYCDDFVIVHKDREYLENLIPNIEKFLFEKLQLTLHERKREMRKVSQDIDFLGYILLPYYCIIRTNTKKRIIRRYKEGLNDVQKESYRGVLSHAKSYKIQKMLENI